MNFNDDEPIVALQESGTRPPPVVEGRVELTSFNKSEAQLEPCNLKVLLEIKGGNSIEDRPGLDLVAVLDVSGSMRGDNIAKLKIAMYFVIKKLSPLDRLSIVTFAKEGKRSSPLHQMTENSQVKLEKMIKDLTAGGGTNMEDGLKIGLKVLKDRRTRRGRVGAIILMSDGAENRTSHAAQVNCGNVPVFTFGLGEEHDPTVLRDIAETSDGGTFSAVPNTDNLSLAFAQCLAGLLTVAVQDLKMNIEQGESTIKEVSAGAYKQSKDGTSVTVTFGDLYCQETRKVLVYLRLDSSEEGGTEILTVNYSYSFQGETIEANSAIFSVNRTSTPSQEDPPEIENEEARVKAADSMKEARILADKQRLDEARQKLDETYKSLDEKNEFIKVLRSEVKMLFDLMETQEKYETLGRPFALSCESSHALQRVAARGNDLASLKLFVTPRMEAYLEQAKKFAEDPSQPVPPQAFDVEKEIEAAKKEIEARKEAAKKEIEAAKEAAKNKAGASDKDIEAAEEAAKKEIEAVEEAAKKNKEAFSFFSKITQTVQTIGNEIKDKVVFKK